MPTLEWKEVETDGGIHFVEALKKYGEPDADGWRLPTKEETEAQLKTLSAEDQKNESTISFWTSTKFDKKGCTLSKIEFAWYGNFYWGNVGPYIYEIYAGIRLVREVQS